MYRHVKCGLDTAKRVILEDSNHTAWVALAVLSRHGNDDVVVVVSP